MPLWNLTQYPLSKSQGNCNGKKKFYKFFEGCLLIALQRIQSASSPNLSSVSSSPLLWSIHWTMFASPRDSEVLVLDPRIRDYVLLPILIVMFMQGILRNNIAKLLRSPPAVPSREKLLKAQPLIRSKQLRATGGFVSSEAFQRRKAELLENSLVPEQVEEKKDGGDEIPAPDMEQLNSTMNMMKGNMAGFIPQMLSMGWVSYFFSGFVVIKMPFPLTDAFKPMLQRGIALSSLDPSYVSSLSWYFLNLFGLQGLFSIFLGGDNGMDSFISNPLIHVILIFIFQLLMTPKFCNFKQALPR